MLTSPNKRSYGNAHDRFNYQTDWLNRISRGGTAIELYEPKMLLEEGSNIKFNGKIRAPVDGNVLKLIGPIETYK